MGGLLAFRVGNYDHTAEREQFRELCLLLKDHYARLEDFCVFAGNYNIGCELDALFIKKDAIVSLEFKNYGGKVVANENGEWMCDNKIIKGGSRKTVLQQARVNHSILKKELKALGIESHQINDIPHLVVFNQPIELENKLSSTNKSWLHITDNSHFLEKLDDITCPHTDITPLELVNLAELLNLNAFYLPEFSNASYDCKKKEVGKISVFEDIKEDVNESLSIDSIRNQLEIKPSGVAPIREKDFSIDQRNLFKFINDVLSTLLKDISYELNIYESQSFVKVFLQNRMLVQKPFIITVKALGIARYSKKISRFIFREINALNNDLLYWEDGETDVSSITNTDILSGKSSPQKIKQLDYDNKKDLVFRKSHTILPFWLDKLIFDQLKAVYSPEYNKYEYNLNLNDNEVAVYLGTYFPRSYAESFCIYDNLLSNVDYHKKIKVLTKINILDVGCGTGGEILGLITILTKYLSEPVDINIEVYDGNGASLKILEVIINALKEHTHHNISFFPHQEIFVRSRDLGLALSFNNQFDFIICNKVVCELISHNVIQNQAYLKVSDLLCPMLTNVGSFLLLDVTIKDERSGQYLPLIMNSELNDYINSNNKYATLIPLACSHSRCEEKCFMQQTFYISHSHKSRDESRVCYRLICERELQNDILSNFDFNAQHIIHTAKYNKGDSSSLCKNVVGKRIIDSFNINQ